MWILAPTPTSEQAMARTAAGLPAGIRLTDHISAALGAYATGKVTLAAAVVPTLTPAEPRYRLITTILDPDRAELRAAHVRSHRGCVVPRGVNRTMSNSPLRARRRQPTCYADYSVQIVK